MVPEAGLEPARYFYRGILSPLCLPIPPLGQMNNKTDWMIILLLIDLSLTNVQKSRKSIIIWTHSLILYSFVFIVMSGEDGFS